MKVTIDLSTAQTARDVHILLAKHLDFGPYYGHNLSALWDVMRTGVERPLKLVLRGTRRCRLLLGEEYEKIEGMLRKVETYDLNDEPEERLTLEIFED